MVNTQNELCRIIMINAINEVVYKNEKNVCKIYNSYVL